MSRSERLLDLLQLLRRHRAPVIGQTIAAELGVSLRTLYRDIATLQAQGLPIDGAPGLGYVLRPGSLLPPPTLTADELETLVLGSRWIASRGDVGLRAAATDALAKIAAVVPAHLRHAIDTVPLLVGPSRGDIVAEPFLDAIRDAIRQEHKLAISYRDAAAAESTRTIWPFALGYFDRVQASSPGANGAGRSGISGATGSSRSKRPAAASPNGARGCWHGGDASSASARPTGLALLTGTDSAGA